MLNVSPLRAFKDNYIWLIRTMGRSGKAAVVDPGEAGPVIEAMDAAKLELVAILLTHHHADHVGGAPELKVRYGAPVIGPKMEPISDLDRQVLGGERVNLDELGLHFDVLHTPGHTLGHVAYYGHGAVFCGDTLFSAGCGRLFEGTPEQMVRSLELLKSLPPQTRVYCGHEYTLDNLRFALAVEPENPALMTYLELVRNLRAEDRPTLPSTLAQEIAVNPFLRYEAPAVREAAERQAQRELRTVVDVFAVLRRWKDGFTSQ